MFVEFGLIDAATHAQRSKDETAKNIKMCNLKLNLT